MSPRRTKSITSESTIAYHNAVRARASSELAVGMAAARKPHRPPAPGARRAGRDAGPHRGEGAARRDQATHLLLGRGAAADHHGAPAAQVEKHRIERGHCEPTSPPR